MNIKASPECPSQAERSVIRTRPALITKQCRSDRLPQEFMLPVCHATCIGRSADVSKVEMALLKITLELPWPFTSQNHDQALAAHLTAHTHHHRDAGSPKRALRRRSARALDRPRRAPSLGGGDALQEILGCPPHPHQRPWHDDCQSLNPPILGQCLLSHHRPSFGTRASSIWSIVSA